MSDRYRASGLACNTVYLSLDCALKHIGIKVKPFSNLVDASDSATFPTIKIPKPKFEALNFFVHVPASCIASDLLHKNAIEQVNAAIATLLKEIPQNHTDLLNRLKETLRARLANHQNLLFGFSVEVLGMSENSDPYFSDNLLMEVADVLIKIIPIGLALEEINPKSANYAKNVARLAIEIRSQIAWGIVSDFDAFRSDVINLYVNLFELVSALGLSPKLLTKYDPQKMTEQLRMYLRQPLELRKNAR